MVMHMLRAGGVPWTPGADPASGEQPDDTELGRVLQLMAAGYHGGTAVKVLEQASVSWVPPAPGGWLCVWLDRDPVQQALSACTLLYATGTIATAPGILLQNAGLTSAHPDGVVARLAEQFGRDRPRAIAATRALGPTLELQYERILAQPRKAAKLLGRHVAPVCPTFDIDAAAAVVHDRGPAATMTLTAEVDMVTQADDAAAGVSS